MEDAKEKLAAVREKISAACLSSGRKLDSVRLVAVSKKQSPDAIRALADLGQMDFGENYMQEAKEKIAAIAKPLRWHFIGALQSNKAKLLLNDFYLFHGLDRLALAEEINRAAAKNAVKVACLAQVNTDDEASKSGMRPSDLAKFLEEAAQLENINIAGLMCIPDPDANTQKSFAQLRELKESMNQNGAYRSPLTELSMGMSADFEAAIREGSTIVRVGTALFGARP